MIKVIVLLALRNEVEELAVFHILHYDIDLGIGLEGLQQLRDVRVSHPLQNPQLPRKINFVAGLHDEILMQYFNGHLLARFGVDGLADVREGALADGPAQLVVPYSFDLLRLLNLLLGHVILLIIENYVF